MKKTFFHEDDFGQIEILPITDLSFCSEQLKKIKNFSKDHQHQDGFGWDDMFIRSENSTNLANLMIKKEEIKAALGSLLYEYENVYTGYSSHGELCPNTIAYGDEHSGKIFFCYDDNEVITAIWCSEIITEICKIPKMNKLLIVDWSWGFVSPLSDNREIEDYICKKSNTIRENYEKWQAIQKTKRSNKKWWQMLVQNLSRFPWLKFKND